MVEGNRMLANLIDILCELEIYLSSILSNPPTTDCSMGNGRSSLTNMKKVLDTLVKKTVAQKNSDEDIAVRNKTPAENADLNFQTLVSTDDYLVKTKHLFERAPDVEILKKQLLTFQELLGDILYSTCQITNYNSRSLSGILVKDLLSVETCYLNIWDLTVLISSKYKNKIETQQSHGYGMKSTFEFQNIYKTLQKGVKELFKVKLNIEHFLKVNIVEMKLFSHEGSSGNNDCEKNPINRISTQCLDSKPKSLKPSVKISSAACQKENMFKTISCKNDEWCEFENGRISNLQQEDLFKIENFSPQEVLFFQEGTILIQSTLGMRLKQSLPKIYSVDSIEEKKQDHNNVENNDEHSKINIEKIKTIESVKIPDINKTSILNKPVNSFTDTIFTVELSDSESVQCKRKVTGKNVFNATPLRIERSNMTCSEPFWKTDLSTKKDNTVKKNDLCSNETTDNTYYLGDIEPNKMPHFCRQEYKEQLCFPCKVSDQVSLSGKNHAIFDKKSVIELFKYPGPCKCREFSHPCQNNSYNVWPVTAEYIHVSRAKQIDNYNSLSDSESSFSMARKCEKSIFSLHLNKKYEEKHEYAEDLVVIDNPVEICQDSSSYSLVNQSYIVYDDDHRELNKVRSQQSSTSKNKATKKQKDCKFTNMVKKNDNDKLLLTTRFESSTDNKYSQFSREHMDFSNLNEYNVHGNWNSYISIFTSKVGPSSQIKHHRVIQRIINKFGGEPLKDKVHTLTSNRGPFRLFDINGYPLTDCAGNVLKDPYGKAVVDLDSTGLPKDDIQVFDAEGNPPKDFKFDPTQRPKTNSIVIKLMDNFKRPLHLFDKYGRPLTDSNGKLLVNVHGRPLLRFDNFGRPTTDYRGGLLYTDNGYRWTFKNDYNCLSNEHIRNMPLEKPSKTTIEDCKKLNTAGFEKIISSKKNDVLKTYESQVFDKKNNICQPNSSIVDKWCAVEQILQKVQKKIQVEPKESQASVIVNNVSITENPLEREFLKPIIYHNSFAGKIDSFEDHFDPSKCIYNYKDNRLKENNTDLSGMNGLTKNTTLANYHHLIRNKVNSRVKNYHTDLTQNFPKDTTNFPFYENIPLETSKSTPQDIDLIGRKHYINSNSQAIYNKNNVSKNPKFPADQNLHQTFVKQYTPSYVTFKNHDYLNHFDSQIQRCKVPFNSNVKYLPRHDILNNRYKRWTETSYTYSDINTTDLTQTESPTLILQNMIRSSQEMEGLKNQYKNKRIYAGNEFDGEENCSEKVISHKQKYLSNLIENCKEDNKRKSSLDKHITSLTVLNQNNAHYEIRVANKLQSCTKVNNETVSSNNLEKMKEIQAKAEKVELGHLDQRKSSAYKNNNFVQYNISENKVSDSPFRFISKAKLDSTLVVKTMQKKRGMDSSQTKNITKPSGRVVKTHSPNFVPTTLNNEKQSPQQRECTLVSFLGIPMKYVLKKFDSKKSPKPHIRNKNKGNSTKINQRDKQSNETKIKTLYDGSKLGKQFMSSSNESKPRKKIICKKDKHQGLLAFKSKSCTDIKGVVMSYSGKGKSEKEPDLKDLLSSSQELKRMSSMVILSSDYPAQSTYSNKRSNEKKHVSQRSRERNREYFYNPESAGKTFQQSPDRSKGRKQFSSRRKESIPSTIKNQQRKLSLFRKVEPAGKYMVKLNR